jgi:hypothetical protein
MEKLRINTPVFAAGLMMAITFMVHVFVGGPELYDSMRISNLSVIEQSSFSVVWHFTSMQLFLFAATLFYLARSQNKALFVFVLVTMIGFALLFVGYGLFDLGSVWPMPQWIAFAITTALMIWGMRTS